ncbi:MAG TPA: DUF748 domain-containing protein [Methylococcus sp.]|nr:DUF748 domain-containing protein [Methylococcus sp.]
MVFAGIANRRLRTAFWIVLAAALAGTLLYAVIGFYLLPHWVSTELTSSLAALSGGIAEVGPVRFNPFDGRFEARKLRLQSAGREPLLSVERFLIDVDWAASIREWSLVVDGRIERPEVRMELDGEGNFRLAGVTFGDSETGPTEAIPVRLREFSIRGGGIDFRDGRAHFAKRLEGIEAKLEDFGPDLKEPARILVQANSEGESLALDAALALAPFRIQGEAQWQAVDLRQFAPYLAGSGFVLDQGRLAADFVFDLRSTEGGIVFAVERLRSSLAETGLRVDPVGNFRGQIPAMQVNALEYDSAGSTLRVGEIVLDRPDIAVASRNEGASWTMQLEKISVAGLKGKMDRLDFAVDEVVAPKIKVSRSPGDDRGVELGVDTFVARGIAADGVGSRFAFAGVEVTKVSLTGLTEGKGNATGIEVGALKLDGIETNVAASKASIREAVSSNLRLTGALDGEGKPRDLRVGSTRVHETVVDWGRRDFAVRSIDSREAEIPTWISAQGIFRLPGDFGSEDTAGDSGKPWSVSIGEIGLKDYAVEFRDETVTPPFLWRMAPLNVTVTGLDTRKGKFMELNLQTGFAEHGRIRLEGKARLEPLEADLKVVAEAVDLHPFQPYLNRATQIHLTRGQVSVKGDLSYSKPKDRIHFGGSGEITGLVTVDKKEGRDFVHWQLLRAEGVIFETAVGRPGRLSIRDLVVDRPYFRVVIGPHRTLNLVEKLSLPKILGSSPANGSQDQHRPFKFVIGLLKVHGGFTDFADLSLEPSVSIGIQDLNGTIRGLSSQEDARADVYIEGNVDETAPVKISGQFNPFRIAAFADIDMRFRNIDLTALSPYSGKFAGYRIEKGKVNLDLHYRLSKRNLVATNKIELDQLVLGERVDSPEATSLPVKFALALMRDSRGRIDIDLPIRGNLDDPQFSILGLLGKAVTSLFAQVLRSPFAAMGVLLDSGSEDAGVVKFPPGSASLDRDEQDKLGKIAQVLKDRPWIHLEIKGIARSDRDSRALAERQLLRQLQNARLIELRMSGEKTLIVEEPDWVDAEYRRLFTQFYRARDPQAPELRDLPSGEPSLSGERLEQARRKVLKSWSITELDLRRLALARQNTIRSYLMQQGVPATRIYPLSVEVLETGPEDIKIPLTLSGS